MAIRLKERLAAVINELDNDSVLADIGCDHGMLSAYALLYGKASRVIAVDISPKSLKKTELLAEKLKLDKLETRLGDGLSVIGAGEVDTVVIAGMGGMEIIKILSNSNNSFEKYVLVPHSNTKELREYLSSNFRIEKDYLVKEGNRFYDVLTVYKGYGELNELQLYFGKNTNNPLLKEMLEPKLEKYVKCLKKAENVAEKEALSKKIDRIERVLEL